MDRRLPRLRLRTRRGTALAGKRFLARVDGWPQSSRLPAAHPIRTLGALGDLQCGPLPLSLPAFSGEYEAGVLPRCNSFWLPTPTKLDTEARVQVLSETSQLPYARISKPFSAHHMQHTAMTLAL